MANSNSLTGYGNAQHGAYSFNDLLGSGQYGAVYSALYDERRVACKVLLIAASIQRESKFLDLCKGEEQVIQKIRFEKLEHFFVLALELGYMNVQEILMKNRSRTLSSENTQRLGWQMIMALEFIASKQIVHCDVKLANIMLTIPAGAQKVVTFKLCDFGVSIGPGLDEMELKRYNYAGMAHATPYILLGDRPTPLDDLIQLSYALIEAQGQRFSGMSFEDMTHCKEELLSNPRSILSQNAIWLKPVCECIGSMKHGEAVDYEDVKEAIREVPFVDDAGGYVYATGKNGDWRLE